MTPHGGKRKGAGRPPEKDRRVTLAVRVEQWTRAVLDELARESGKSIGEVIDEMTYAQHIRKKP